MCISLYSGTTVYADESDGTEELVKYGEDWQKLMDLPVKLPEKREFLFSSDELVYDDVSQKYVIDDACYIIPDFFNFDINYYDKERTILGIIVSSSSPYLYYSYIIESNIFEEPEDFDEGYMAEFKLRDKIIGQSSFSLPREYYEVNVGSKSLENISDCFLLLYDMNDFVLENYLYKIPFSELHNYLPNYVAEEYYGLDNVKIEEIGNITLEVGDTSYIVKKKLRLSWSSYGKALPVRIDIIYPSDSYSVEMLSDEDRKNGFKEFTVSDESGEYNFNLWGSFFDSISTSLVCDDIISVEDINFETQVSDESEYNVKNLGNFDWTIIQGDKLSLFVPEKCIVTFKGDSHEVTDCFVFETSAMGYVDFEITTDSAFASYCHYINKEFKKTNNLYIVIVISVLLGGGICGFILRKSKKKDF